VSTVLARSCQKFDLHISQELRRGFWQSGEFVGHEAHLPGLTAVAGNRMTSGGVLLSLPAQKGQASTSGGTTLAGRLLANSSGRLARSAAMMTDSFGEVVLA
jgi:hypothetical protein